VSSIAIVDTNVVVAGLLTSNPDAPTVRILDGMLTRRFAFALSEALISEYRAVLLRPKIQVRHGLGPDAVDEILTRLALEGIVVDPVEPATTIAPDPGDQLLWDLMESVALPVLVTGDERLRKASLPRGRALAPADLCTSVSI
jgi:putative PIN family toxin of toxin-antitoxin system